MDSYSKMFMHIIFIVKYRERVIEPAWEEELYKYITGIITQKGQKLLAINGVRNHIHFLIGVVPSCVISDLVREIKKASTAFVNDRKFTKGKFQWQPGYTCYSVGHLARDKVIRYIRNQKEHHGEVSVKDEFMKLLWEHEISYREENLPDWLE